jgi:hypothetical protein
LCWLEWNGFVTSQPLFCFSLVLTNLALYYVCRKRVFSPGASSSTSLQLETKTYGISMGVGGTAVPKHNKVRQAPLQQQEQLFHMQGMNLRQKSCNSTSIHNSMENTDCLCCSPVPQNKVSKVSARGVSKHDFSLVCY